MATAHKYTTLQSYDCTDFKEEDEKEEKKEFKKEENKSIDDILNDIEQLSNEECKILSSQTFFLADKTLQTDALNEILKVYPKLSESFSIVSDFDGQASYLLTMVKKGYDGVVALSYKKVYNTIKRHRNYNISEQCMIASCNKILQSALKTIESMQSAKTDIIQVETESNDSESDEFIQSKNAWKKANAILIDIISKAFTTKRKLNKNRHMIQRSMTDEDIKCVLSIWHTTIQESKHELNKILAQKIKKNNNIYIVFQRANINIFKQSSIIINMLDTTFNELSHTDELIPFLQKIGTIHANMNIKPQLLALMKKIILDTIKEILSFNYTDNIKEAWNRVLAFIIGIMIRKSYHYHPTLGNNNSNSNNARPALDLSRTGSVSLYSARDSTRGTDSYDIEGIENRLTDVIIQNCQQSWQRIETVINKAVNIFYNDLHNSQRDIKQLFSKTNMKQQSAKLCKAIGSTVALLDEPETLIPILIELGKRHVFYGVKPDHFKYLKKCWFRMLRKALSLNWNDEIKHSWKIAWAYITYYMKTSLEDALLLYIPPEPILVNFKVLINNIKRIKLNDSSFYANLWVLADTGTNKSQSYAFNSASQPSKQSLPPFVDVACLNAMQTIDKFRSANGENYNGYIRYFEDDDSWYLRGNIIGTYSNTYQLNAYPFDTHNIEIIFALQVDDTIAMFNENQLSVRLMPFTRDLCDYNVYQPQMSLVESSAIKGGSSSGKRYTHCKVIIPISRKYIYYVYNVIIPLLIMQLIQFSIYFIELFPISDRVIISLLLLITIFAFNKSIQTHSLPAVPYFTLLDHMFNGSYLLFIYHIIGLCILYQLKYLGQDLCTIINIIIGVTGIFIFFIINCFLYLKARHLISLYPKRKNEDEGKHALDIIAKNTANTSKKQN